MRFLEARNEGLDLTAAWKSIVLGVLTKAIASGANVGPNVINEVVHFPGGRITDVGVDALAYINFRLFSIGDEPTFLRLLLDDQGKDGSLHNPSEAELDAAPRG